MRNFYLEQGERKRNDSRIAKGERKDRKHFVQEIRARELNEYKKDRPRI